MNQLGIVYAGNTLINKIVILCIIIDPDLKSCINSEIM